MLDRYQFMCLNNLGDFKHHSGICWVTVKDLGLLLLTVSHKNSYEKMLDSFDFFKPQQESSKKFQWKTTLVDNGDEFHFPLIGVMVEEKENQAQYAAEPEKLNVWMILKDKLCEQSEAKLVAEEVEPLWNDKKPQLLMIPYQPDFLHLFMILQLGKHNSLIQFTDKCSLISDLNDYSGIGTKVHGNQRRAN